MKILLQRVRRAEVAVGDETIARIGRGVLLLVGFGREEDVSPDFARAVDKIVNLRIFAGADGKAAQSLPDIGGAVLAVPQFTLYGATRQGRRPDFTRALAPELAASHFEALLDSFRRSAVVEVQAGRFGADMAVSLVNDGPFTLMLEQ